MLQRKLFLILTVLLTLAAVAVSWLFSPEIYKAHVWPYILIIMGFSFFRYLFFILGSLLEGFRSHDAEGKFQQCSDDFLPRVSIIVPAYNEAAVIAKTIGHLATLNYPNYEIIVVDDGSRDNTYQIALTAAAEFSHLDIQVFTKPNGGKSEALNYGFIRASGALIMGVDADSRLHTDSLTYGVQHFRFKNTGAVAGYVEIDNPRNMLEDLQQLEYMVSLNFLRKAYSFLGIVPIVPGPVGLFRREALDQVHGMTDDRKIFAEDAELSLRLISAGWRIRSEERMIAYTEAPSDFKSFFRQRYRWNRGTFQALSKNFFTLINSPSHLARFLALHLYIEVWILPLINILLVYNFIIRLLVYGEVHLFTVWMAYVFALELWMLVVVSRRQKRFLWALCVMFWSKFFYENLLFFWRMFSLLDEWRDKRMTWDKLDRSSNLKDVTYG